MAQDFWASSGYRALERRGDGLVATDAWLAGFIAREELAPPAGAGPAEIALHARLARDPRAPVDPAEVAAVEDSDARENWTAFLRFRDRVLAHDTLEAAYLSLFRGADVDVAPAFVDALAQAIVRHLLEGTGDAWLCRAGELWFRPQRVSTADGRVLCADAATLERFADTGGFGNVGRLLRAQGTATVPVKMDVLSAENAALYFLRDELHSFALDLTAGGEGAAAFARLLERWIAHLLGVRVAIEPVTRIDDERWRWHVGLDVDATAILNALYRGEAVPAADLERVALLMRLAFADPDDAAETTRGRPVYLALACRPDRTLRFKPQNLLANLPLASAAPRGG